MGFYGKIAAGLDTMDWKPENILTYEVLRNGS
jgi:hypothetical protein